LVHIASLVIYLRFRTGLVSPMSV